MADKALFHAVDMKNGHDEWYSIVPAQSAQHAKSLFETEHIAVTKVTCLDWCLVDVGFDGSDVVFTAQAGGQRCFYEPGTPGYEFLINYFHVQVSKILHDVREIY
ncbi:hypothetical protein [Aeromonas veronii]|jgi:hypothetical protein|uniref:hypothetical protein n=1 Tax=Aeromonas veronii TaxID=654 RepID=UPI0011175793|nr:hypothetical protein [Aeromonas veronii]